MPNAAPHAEPRRRCGCVVRTATREKWRQTEVGGAAWREGQAVPRQRVARDAEAGGGVTRRKGCLRWPGRGPVRVEAGEHVPSSSRSCRVEGNWIRSTRDSPFPFFCSPSHVVVWELVMWAQLKWMVGY
uniref:Uncharacterized protein n=1 Tax=Oryza barthii TaxID=65489 RepID=A0A0D3HSC0_9ORYZ